MEAAICASGGWGGADGGAFGGGVAFCAADSYVLVEAEEGIAS